MNITDQTADKIGGEIKQIIKDNSQIQMYANDNLNKYVWRDSRFMETKDLFDNEQFDTIEELIEGITKHLNKWK